MGRPDNVIAALYANRLPDSIIFRGGDGSLLSTAAARAKVERFAASLLRLGVRPGDRISMRVEKSLNAILLAHACLWIGAILHPLNNAYTPHELAALLADAEPALLITSPDEFVALRPVGEQAQARVIALDGETSTWLADPSTSAKPHAPSRPDEGAVLLYTSGTTGKPKGALITHENLLSSARALSTIWGVTGGDILLHALPIFHAHGLLTSINTMIAGGGSVLLLPSFNVDAVLAALRGCTMMMGVPTHYARLVQHPAFPEAIGPDFRLAISGSAPLPESLANDFTRLSRVPLLERYGSTEATIITGIPFTVADRTGWVGWPLPDVSIRVAASGGHRSTVGIGAVETRGPNVFAGYWRNDRTTAEAFTSDGWFITGDIGEIDGSGCLRLLGREKDLIISGGLNVYPAEVENEMHRLGGVKEAAAFGVPHPDFGEAVVGAVQLVAGAEFDERSAIAALRDRLAAYKTPKRIVVVDELPRNAIGKIVKTSLRESFSGLFTAQQQIKGKH